MGFGSRPTAPNNEPLEAMTEFATEGRRPLPISGEEPAAGTGRVLQLRNIDLLVTVAIQFGSLGIQGSVFECRPTHRMEGNLWGIAFRRLAGGVYKMTTKALRGTAVATSAMAQLTLVSAQSVLSDPQGSEPIVSTIFGRYRVSKGESTPKSWTRPGPKAGRAR